MQTLLLYLLIMVVVVVAVFAVVWFVFGRGEDLPPLDDDTTLTRLPAAGIAGDDVRALVFAQTVRGYKPREVDWALERLAAEIDELRSVVLTLQARDAAEPVPASGAPVYDSTSDHISTSDLATPSPSTRPPSADGRDTDGRRRAAPPADD